MTREELYQEAKAKRKQEKEKPKGGFGGFEQPEWHAIETNYSQVRFIGNYPMARHGDPTAAKIINVAMIVGDDGKKFRCIYPLREERKIGLCGASLIRLQIQHGTKLKDQKV